MARIGTGNNWAQGPLLANGTMGTWSAHFFLRVGHNAGTAAIRKALAFREGTGGSPQIDMGFSYDHTGAAFSQAAYWRNNSAAYFSAKLTTALLANTTYAIGVSLDGSNLRAYLNGALETTTPLTGVTIGVGCTPAVLNSILGTEQLADGEIAEVGIWSNAVLTADEFSALSNGFTPPKIRPASLIQYVPFVRNNVNLKEAAWTDTGTPAWSDHPRVF